MNAHSTGVQVAVAGTGVQVFICVQVAVGDSGIGVGVGENVWVGVGVRVFVHVGVGVQLLTENCPRTAIAAKAGAREPAVSCAVMVSVPPETVTKKDLLNATSEPA